MTGYQCPHCPQTRATRAGIQGHIKRDHWTVARQSLTRHATATVH